jgi:glyoxylase-like metal-dependent hydrolase (beta-lactamase superfamily II)
MRNLIFTCIAAALVGAAHSQDKGQVITYSAGDFMISILSEGGGPAGSSLLKGASADQVSKYLPDGTFLLETQAFLIRGGGKNILVDTGHGRHLFANLKELGVSAGDINAVLLTHLHPDHIGGMLLDGQAAFPRAELYLSQAEYDYWTNPAAGGGGSGNAARNAVSAYGGRLRLFVPSPVEEEGGEILPGIRAVAAYGHTPGHTAFLIRSDEGKWLIWGDAAHAMDIQMPCPEVAMTFDADAQQAVIARKNLLEYAASNNIIVGGMHIAFPSAGKIMKGKDGGYGFTPLCLCEGF